MHGLARTALGSIWVYHGVVPKLLVRDSGELESLRGSGRLRGREPLVLSVIGLAEAAFGLAMLTGWRARWHFLANLLALPILAAGAVVSQPRLYVVPFQPRHTHGRHAGASGDRSAGQPRPAVGGRLPAPTPGRLRMTSIYQRALGSDFARLHPQVQRRFGFSSHDGIASIGRGVVQEVRRGALYTLPFLLVGT